MNKVKEIYSYAAFGADDKLVEKINEFAEEHEILNIQYIYTPANNNVCDKYRAFILYKEE